MSTIFSKIITGEAEGSFVYRDDLVAAFMDIEPVNRGHVLVVPIHEVASFCDLDDSTCERLMVVAKKIVNAIKNSDIPCDGVNLYLADGASAGQEVFHVHLHVVPRVKGDGFQLNFPGTGVFQSEREELDQAAELIANSLDAQCNK